MQIIKETADYFWNNQTFYKSQSYKL